MNSDGERGPYTIAPDELTGLLGSDDLRVVDGSWYLPAQNRDAKAEFAQARIPGAVYFDIDAISDGNSDLPHMLPDATVFAAAAGALGVAETDDIVVYDGPGMFSSPRVWWTFRVMGAKRVRVLDGGFDNWRAAGLPVETSDPRPPEPAMFRASLDAAKVTDMATIRAGLKAGEALILDARSFERYAGQAPEPRPGLRSGHIPGSRSLPFQRLTENGRLKDRNALEETFSEYALEDRSVVTSCGSGVTAAVISLALETIGHPSHSLFDGSWAQWGAADDTPVARWED